MYLLIYGASGLAKEVYDIVVRSLPTKYKQIIFIDDFADEAPYYLSESIHFDTIKERFDTDGVEGVVAVGEPQYREQLAKKFDANGIKLATIIDKTAIISPTAIIEDGVIICEYTTIHANVRIGRGALIQPFCDIGHDIRFGEYSVMSAQCAPGGESTFGNRVYMGMQAVSKEKISIGDDVIIAMGAAVFSNVEEGATVVGNPARITKGNKKHHVFNTR